MKITVRNWNKWQSYRKDRGTPPWIKIHRQIMSNPDWAKLSDAEKGQLISIWIVAADKNGEIPGDPRILRKVCQLDEAPNISKFTMLGFLDSDGCQGDAMPTPDGCQGDAPEERRGEERRREERRREEEKTLSVSQAKADPVPYDSILNSANVILGKQFRTTDKHKTIIKARWKEGFREPDFDKVCQIMLQVWGNDPKMQAYLRPETLFGTKMDGYLNTAPIPCNKQLSRSEQWRQETKSEVDSFVYGDQKHDQDNGQHTGQAALC